MAKETIKKRQGEIRIDADLCKECGLCVATCPLHLIAAGTSLNRNGYHPAVFKDDEMKCSGCGACRCVCPDVAIDVYKETPLSVTEPAKQETATTPTFGYLSQIPQEETPRKPKFMMGNHAVVHAALRAGCGAFYGYPITPSSEALELAMELFPKFGRIAKQLEAEQAVGFALYGAGAVGVRAFTITSGPGMAWLNDAVNYMSMAEIPGVIIDVMRGGPALGNIAPSQADYNQAVTGGGNGDYRAMVLAASSVQELADLTVLSFELADKYRNPVILLSDGLLGQMKESVILPEWIKTLPPKPWTLGCTHGRESRKIIPFNLEPKNLEADNKRLQAKYRLMEQDIRFEAVNLEKADILVVAFGLVGRIVKSVIKKAEAKGIKVGLIRPITVCPFPESVIQETASKIGKVLVVEMNCGQMLKDVKLAVAGKAPVYFYGRAGGVVPGMDEIVSEIESLLKKKEVKS